MAAAGAGTVGVPGVAIGHATDAAGGTGLTIVRGITEPLRGGVAVVGRATGSRELNAVSPDSLSGRIDAIMLTGGSAYGLDAAAGAMRWMEEHGRGFPVGEGVVPIVPAAVIFDLGPCGRFDARPTPEMAYAACESATASGIAEGSVGAGTGATVGKGAGIERAMKGGVGLASVTEGRGDAAATVAALAVVNAFGDVRGADGGIVAGARIGAMEGNAGAGAWAAGGSHQAGAAREEMRNTTLAVVMTAARLSRVELTQLARAATAALYRRITPAGTSFDGDMVFAVSAASAGGPPHNHDAPHPARQHHHEPAPISTTSLLQLERLAVRALEEAIERAVRLARGRDGVPGLADDTATA